MSFNIRIPFKDLFIAENSAVSEMRRISFYNFVVIYFLVKILDRFRCRLQITRRYIPENDRQTETQTTEEFNSKSANTRGSKLERVKIFQEARKSHSIINHENLLEMSSSSSIQKEKECQLITFYSCLVVEVTINLINNISIVLAGFYKSGLGG